MVLSLRCDMHGFQLIVKDLFLLPTVNYHNQLFCFTNLYKLGVFAASLRKRCHQIIDSKFRTKFVKPNPDDMRWTNLFLTLTFVKVAPGGDHDEDVEINKRRVAMERFSKVIGEGKKGV